MGGDPASTEANAGLSKSTWRAAQSQDDGITEAEVREALLNLDSS
jgi:hypothetical protein